MVFLYYMNNGLMKVAAVMLKIDLFAFGGGFAALPLMFHQVVDVKGWIDSKTFMDGIALGQITPGPIIITATFIGYLLYGFAGALVSTIAILTPSLLVVLLTAPFFDRLKNSRFFLRATRAILATFVGLLLFVAIKFALSISWTILSALFGIAAFIALFKTDPRSLRYFCGRTYIDRAIWINIEYGSNLSSYYKSNCITGTMIIV